MFSECCISSLMNLGVIQIQYAAETSTSQNKHDTIVLPQPQVNRLEPPNDQKDQFASLLLEPC